MSYTYAWTDAEQTILRREDENGKVAWVPTDPRNTSYKAFLSSGAIAAPYVEPPPPPPLSTEEKVNRLLSDYGLTRAELRATLDATEAISS